MCLSGLIPVGQSTASAPFASVQTTKNSMAHDQPHPQSLRPPEHMPSSNTIRLPGQPLYAASEFPQTQFQHNVIAPANEVYAEPDEKLPSIRAVSF